MGSRKVVLILNGIQASLVVFKSSRRASPPEERNVRLRPKLRQKAIEDRVTRFKRADISRDGLFNSARRRLQNGLHHFAFNLGTLPMPETI